MSTEEGRCDMPSKEVEIAKAYEELVKALNKLEELGENPLRGYMVFANRTTGFRANGGDVWKDGTRWHCNSLRAEEAPYKRGDSVRIFSEDLSYFGHVTSVWPSGDQATPWLVNVKTTHRGETYGVLCGPSGECNFMERVEE